MTIDIEQWLPLVGWVVRNYFWWVPSSHGVRSRMDTNDLYQQGVIALMRAAGKYDHANSAGASFKTYATVAIRREMSRYVDHNRCAVSMGDGWQANMTDIQQRILDGETLSDATLRTLWLYRRAIRCKHLSSPCGKRQNNRSTKEELSDRVADDYERRDVLKDFLERQAATLAFNHCGLSDRERDILERRMDGYTLHDCGKIYNITRERVRQIEARGFSRIAKYIESLGMQHQLGGSK